ncbi:DsrE family protein [Candidatus Bathyarchaeota archaeon]|nr:DsrE family protein [Candidatus Bathyarchaeota archaeon]
MAEKKTLIVIKSRPVTDLNYYEALRTAAGFWDHPVTILWIGDGVYAALDKTDKSITGKFLADLPDLDVELYVDADSLTERGFTGDNLVEAAQPADQAAVLGLFESAEASFVF